MKRIIIFLLFLPVAVCPSFAQLVLSQSECREMALKNNEKLKKSSNAVSMARLDKSIAAVSRLPSIKGSFTGVYKPDDINLMGYDLRMRGTYLAGISLSEPLYAGGKINTANRLASIGEESAGEIDRKSRMEVIYDADNAYWSYIAVNEKVKMLGSYRRQLQSLYEETKNKLHEQMNTDNDLLRIGTRLSQVTYQLQKAENGVELCRLSLCNVIGIDLNTSVIASDTLFTVNAPPAMENDISESPDLKLLEEQVEACRERIKMVRADFLPTVALSAQYACLRNLKLNGTTTDDNGNSVSFGTTYDNSGSILMFSVSVPIFHFGEGRKKIRKAELQMENSRLDLQQNRRLLSIALQQAIQNVTDGYNMILTAEAGMKQAEENLRVTRERYNNSMCTLTDLLDSQFQWQEAYGNLIESKARYKIYETAYMKASGRYGPIVVKR